MSETASITFLGGADTVTGSNFLLEIAGKRILIDCGLEQGSDVADMRNREDFGVEPSSVDVLLITHAHADHIGRVPKLVRDGYKGPIYSTPATRELAAVMLPDACRLLGEEAARKGLLPLYEEKDVADALGLWRVAPYYQFLDLGAGISVYPKDSGHILGSAMYEISYQGKKIVFTGDLGNSPSLFLRDTDKITDATYLVMESVYGDRNHEPKDERRERLRAVVRETVAKKRTLVIPAFSLERTQDMLYELNKMVEGGEVPEVRVYIDSPLATAVTEVYKRYGQDFKESARKYIAEGDDLFQFPKLKFTAERRDSERIDSAGAPKIIVAGSGMSNGGRILHHEKKYLPDPNATLLLVGYQTLGTLGRRIQDGAKEVVIEGERIKVRAKVEEIMGYSSHKDSDRLVDFVADTDKTVKKVFVAMGEPKAAMFLAQRLRDYLGVDAIVPKRGDKVDIEL